MDRLCEQCKHSAPATGRDLSPRERKDNAKCALSGKPPLYCVSERGRYGQCGPAGKKWEAIALTVDQQAGVDAATYGPADDGCGFVKNDAIIVARPNWAERNKPDPEGSSVSGPYSWRQAWVDAEMLRKGEASEAAVGQTEQQATDAMTTPFTPWIDPCRAPTGQSVTDGPAHQKAPQQQDADTITDGSGQQWHWYSRKNSLTPEGDAACDAEADKFDKLQKQV